MTSTLDRPHLPAEARPLRMAIGTAASATMALVPIAMFFVVLAGRAGLRALRSRRVRADRRRAVVETPTRRSVSP